MHHFLTKIFIQVFAWLLVASGESKNPPQAAAGGLLEESASLSSLASFLSAVQRNEWIAEPEKLTAS